MNRPLEGKRVLVTRPQGQSSQLTDRLVELGAIPISMPAIEILSLSDFTELDAALEGLSKFDWVIFTSVNGVAAVLTRMDRIQIPRRLICERRIAVIGPVTSAAVEREFRKPDLMPVEYISEAIVDGVGDPAGQRFLLLRADIARKELANILRQRGAVVTEAAAYRIVQESVSIPDAGGEAPDYIALTSSSSVLATHSKLREAGCDEWLQTASIVSIGPITSKTVRELGYRVAVQAAEFTIPGLVKAIADHARQVQHA